MESKPMIIRRVTLYDGPVTYGFDVGQTVEKAVSIYPESLLKILEPAKKYKTTPPEFYKTRTVFNPHLAVMMLYKHDEGKRLLSEFIGEEVRSFSIFMREFQYDILYELYEDQEGRDG